jgi:hypothetical protein
MSATRDSTAEEDTWRGLRNCITQVNGFESESRTKEGRLNDHERQWCEDDEVLLVKVT